MNLSATLSLLHCYLSLLKVGINFKEMLETALSSVKVPNLAALSAPGEHFAELETFNLIAIDDPAPWSK